MPLEGPGERFEPIEIRHGRRRFIVRTHGLGGAYSVRPGAEPIGIPAQPEWGIFEADPDLERDPLHSLGDVNVMGREEAERIARQWLQENIEAGDGP